MNIAGKITYHLSVLAQSFAPRIPQLMLTHIPAQKIARINHPIMRGSSTSIRVFEIFTRKHRPIGSDPSVVGTGQEQFPSEFEKVPFLMLRLLQALDNLC